MPCMSRIKSHSDHPTHQTNAAALQAHQHDGYFVILHEFADSHVTLWTVHVSLVSVSIVEYLLHRIFAKIPIASLT